MSQKSRLLIADDEPMIRFTMDALLRPLDVDIVFAENGPQALEFAASQSPDIILLDVMMPGMDGFEVCRRLRANPRLAEIPILMVTALDDRQTRIEGIRAGADDFLTKPIDKVELTARVQSVLRLNRYRRLMAERSKFEWLAEQSAEGCLLLGQDQTIQYANPRARLLLDLPALPAEIGAVSFLDAARRNYHLEPPACWSDWPSQRTERAMLVRVETRDSRGLWLEVQSRPLPAPAGGILVRLLDVTDQLGHCRDTWKLHSFLSHKLRTPLVGIEGSLEMLGELAAEDASGEVAEWVGLAKLSAERLRGAVTDILSFVEAPALARDGTGVAVSSIREISQGLAGEMALGQVEINMPEFSENLRLVVSSETLESILSELFENSKKFHPRNNPRIRLFVSHADAGELLLEVRDDGVTLSPAHLSRLGIPFFQAEKRFTGEVQGMGLGLAMVRSILLELGGNLMVRNSPEGQGVAVVLRIPCSINAGESGTGAGEAAEGHLAPVI